MLRNVRKSFRVDGQVTAALDGVNLVARDQEFVTLIGPSGCGKSTLLHVLGFMTAPDAGRIVLNGRTVSTRPAEMNRLRRRHVGFIFQRFNLLGQLTAADNVAISLRVRGLRADGQADALFETLGIAHVAARKPGEMSIGEQQRVAVVRALAHRPALLLADEPTGNLDSKSGAEVMALLQRLNREQGITVVLVTHDLNIARYTSRIIRLRDGHIVGEEMVQPEEVR